MGRRQGSADDERRLPGRRRTQGWPWAAGVNGRTRRRVLAAMLLVAVLPVGVLLQRAATKQTASASPTAGFQPPTTAADRSRTPQRSGRRPGIPGMAATSATPTPPTTAAGTVATDPVTVAAIRRDARWVLRAQLPDGAIAIHLDRAAVWPYLANYAAIGLVEASRRTGEPRYLQAAWRWLAWYQARQDRQGFVTDYRRSGPAMVSTGDMDSTDAYAGTFLLAVRAAVLASGDRARLETLRAGIGGAVRAIEATQDRDGLTWAKPSWRVKYLMDQAETYAGLRAASELGRVLGDQGLAARAAQDAERLRAGVAALWNPVTGAYDWAKHGDGARQRTNWTVLYPDALQQVWAVAFGLTDRRRGALLVARFDAAQPRWDQPTATALDDRGRRKVGYWTPVGWAHVRVGELRAARAAAVRIRAAAEDAGRRWPFTPSDAAQLIMLQTSDLDLLLP